MKITGYTHFKNLPPPKQWVLDSLFMAYWCRAYVVLPVSKIRWENRLSSPDLFSEIIYYEVWKWGSKSAHRLIYLWYIIYRIKLISSWWYITAVFPRQNNQVEQRFSVSFLLLTYFKNIFLSITVTQ